MSDSATQRFRAETQESISHLQQVVSSHRLDEPQTVHRLFRAVHSLKSEAASRGLRNLARRANTLESHLARLRSGEETAGTGSRAELLEALTELAELAQSDSGPEADERHTTATPDADADVPHGEATPVMQRHGSARAARNPEELNGRSVIGLTEHAKKLVIEAMRRGEQLWQVTCRVREQPEMLYPRLYLAVSNLEQSVNVIQTDPPLEHVPTDLREFSALVSGPQLSEPIHKALSIDGIQDVRVSRVSADSLMDATPETEHQAMALDEQISIGAAQVEELRLYADELQYQLKELGTQLGGGTKAPSTALNEQGRVRFDLAQKLTKTLLHELSRHSQVQLSTLLSRVVGTAESDAAAQQKRVRVHTEGTGHRLFLPVAEVLGEAILHLVRNAVAHGIERTEERRRREKPDVGHIQVTISQEKSAGVLVHVTDDGAGIDLEGSTDELLEQLSTPGFSTKTTADERSGRGVGLDVVRYNVERLLGGTVALESNRPGAGCSFVLRIPNSGTVLGVLVVWSSKQYLAIPRVYVQTRRRINKEQLATDNTGAYFFRHGSTYLRVVTPAGGRISQSGNKWAVVLRLPTRRVALIVEECISEELVVRGSRNRSEVYSKTLDQTVQLFLPLRYL